MKLRFRLVMLAALAAAAPSRNATAQTPGPDPLGRRISVRFDQVDLATALTRLRTVFGIPLAFSAEALPADRSISLAATEQPVADVLSRLLDGTGLRIIPLAGGAVVIAPAGRTQASAPARSPAPEIAMGVRELDQIVVMGTPVSGAQAREQTSAVSVVQGKELGQYRFSRTADLFRTVLPGVVIWDRGPSGPPAEIAAVRGASSFTARGLKTYIDGVEVASPTLITLLDSRSIERIEVIRGPQGAALYGSDAINGVIQVVTRKGSMGESPKVQATAAVAAGPFDRDAVSTMLRQDYAGSMTWGGPMASMAAGGSWGRVGNAGSVPNTRAWSANAGGQAAFGSLLLSASIRGGQFDFAEDQFREVQVSSAPAAGTAGQVDVATVGATAVHQVRDWWIQTMVLGYDRAAGSLGGGGTYFATMREPLGATHETAAKTSIRYSSAFTAGWGADGSVTATAGLEYSRLARHRGTWDNGITGAPQYLSLYGDQVKNAGTFLQAKLRAGPLLFNAGTRAEWSSAFGADYGTSWSPSLGASWTEPIGELAVRLRAGWGRGIRPPEPGMSRGMTGVTIRQEANPELAPESQAGIELGADVYAGATSYLRATYFDQRASDLIQSVMLPYEPGTLRAFQYQNVGAIRNRGVEIEAGTRRGRLGLDGQLYLTSSRVERIAPNYSGSLRVGDQLPEIPRASGSARISYLGSRFQVALGATYLGSWTGYDWAGVAMADAGLTQQRATARDYLIEYPGLVKPYFTFSYDLARELTGYLSIDNVTNSSRFEQHNGNPPAGRSVMVGVEVRP